MHYCKFCSHVLPAAKVLDGSVTIQPGKPIETTWTEGVVCPYCGAAFKAVVEVVRPPQREIHNRNT